MKKILWLSLLLVSCITFAEVPIEDLTSQAPSNQSVTTSSIDTSQLSVEQRLTQLEQQMKFIQGMSIAAKMQQLQQEIQDLRGIVEIQGHEIKQLQVQQRSLYNDLDQRIEKLNEKPIVAPMTTTNTSDSVSAEKKPITSDKELKAYQAAFVLVKNKQYSDAIDAFNHYLSQFSQGKYAANSHYWLGELYVISGNKENAKAEFFTVYNTYPNSEKAPDALYKLGLLAYNQSTWNQAKQWWEMLLKKYPSSKAAQMATPELNKLKKSGLV